MPSSYKSTNRLTTVVESLGSANKALRDVIQLTDDEIKRLEEFENKFRDMSNKFSEFKMLASKHDEQADNLQTRLYSELDNLRKNRANLIGQISHLKEEIKKQERENEGLERELKENCKRLNSFI